MTRTKGISFSILLVTLSAAAPAAAAAPMAKRGTFMLSAERLFGFGLSQATNEDINGSVKQSHFGLSIAPLFDGLPNPYVLPRVAFDALVTDGLTLGGAVGFVVGETDNRIRVGDNTVESEGDEFTTVLLAPRVGYLVGLGPVLGLWLKGGITYYSHAVTSPNGARATYSGVGFNLEPALVLSPAQSVAFTIGLVLDLPASGELRVRPNRGAPSTSTDVVFRNFGIVAGLTGMFF